MAQLNNNVDFKIDLIGPFHDGEAPYRGMGIKEFQILQPICDKVGFRSNSYVWLS